jgi:hypothetical protein
MVGCVICVSSEEYMAVWNENPRPFVWNATVDAIVEKLKGCRQTPEQIKPGCTSPPTHAKAK